MSSAIVPKLGQRCIPVGEWGAGRGRGKVLETSLRTRREGSEMQVPKARGPSALCPWGLGRCEPTVTGTAVCVLWSQPQVTPVI